MLSSVDYDAHWQGSSVLVGSCRCRWIGVVLLRIAARCRCQHGATNKTPASEWQHDLQSLTMHVMRQPAVLVELSAQVLSARLGSARP